MVEEFIIFTLLVLFRRRCSKKRSEVELQNFKRLGIQDKKYFRNICTSRFLQLCFGEEVGPLSPRYSLSYSPSTDFVSVKCQFFPCFAHSPRAADPTTVNMCNHTAQVTAHHACAEDGDFKCPHPPNIGRDIRLDRWLACGRSWVWGTCGVCAQIKMLVKMG